MRTIVITQSGTEYTISHTTTQDMVVTWEDRNGDPRVKGGRSKVIEHVQVLNLHEGCSFQFKGYDRYGRAVFPFDEPNFTWHTTPVVYIQQQ